MVKLTANYFTLIDCAAKVGREREQNINNNCLHFIRTWLEVKNCVDTILQKLPIYIRYIKKKIIRE